ncbi:hypothetical protein M011DRAFT_449195 [Sporormia fimetaria CBS 119925]|uniref:EDC4-like protein pdc1 beta-propeller domain-containing protein n=1 Tax=Sporormia fimetaria CBS 119925 TaxID=1340428 RepID=A0A6A6V3U6_9PLEO|nr:hypothetical protein M011DRAFT_449195 [Sporormia fimetaria CBS 119925]
MASGDEQHFQEMLARMSQSRSQSGTLPGATAPAHDHSRYQPTVSSPIYSPPLNGIEPRHASAVMSPTLSTAASPATQPVPQPQQQQQSAQLLNLLRFSSARSPSQPTIASQQRPLFRSQSVAGSPAQPQQASVSDLAASFTAIPPAPPSASGTARNAATESTQDLLLRLLNQPKPSQTSEPARAAPPMDAPVSTEPETAQELAAAKESPVPDAQTNSPMRLFGHNGAEPTPFKPEASAKPMFTYVNPFDKLEEASPRKRTPVSRGPSTPAPKVEILKPKHAQDPPTLSSDERDQPTRKSRKLSPTPAGRAHPSVAEAVSNLGEQVNKQVEDALANAELKSEAQTTTTSKQTPRAMADKERAGEQPARKAEGASKLPENVVEHPTFKPSPKGSPEPADADVVENWEAEAEASVAGKHEAVTVFTLPMKPFVSINMNKLPSPTTLFQPDMFMDLARMKKDFDQIDRSLVAASKHFIVWALPKKGGFRIIKQANGESRQVFENHNERVFNIAICTSGTKANDLESILAIGVNGSVFWTSLQASREDQFSENLDVRGIVLPPCPAQDDNTSGGQLKTRAKPSSRHPEFFAIGRGKSIHIVWPKVAAEYVQGGKGVCQTEKYLQERALKIHTGKAGKDFTFSEDDTVIVSLDKAGRMRFWDVRSLTNPEVGIPGQPRQVEVSETLLEFHTTSPAAKSWPTSVFFFDKDKPFATGIALRYVMVGMKQNHSFQLWDLHLGRAVEEINLPHEKESDAICSVAFHPRSSIMAVAHPTRNSIFFVHISCPRYNLPIMNQATYLSNLAAVHRGDRSAKSFPGPNATAIMSSISEYSFASKGQLRSVHMLNEPENLPQGQDPEDAALFELYVMHSKGVCSLRIRRSDLALQQEGKPNKDTTLESQGLISVSPLNSVSPNGEDSSTSGEPSKAPSERSTRDAARKESSNVSRQSMTPEAAMRASTLAKVESKQDAARAAMINGGEKAEKKNKKRSKAESTAGSSQTSSVPRPTATSYAQAAQATAPSKSPAPPETSVANAASPTSNAELIEWMKKFTSQYAQQQPSAPPAAAPPLDTKRFQQIVQSEIGQALKGHMEALYKRMDDDRRAAAASNLAQQEAVIRLVSSSLTENVEAVLGRIVEDTVRKVALPKLLEGTSGAVEKSVNANVNSAVADQVAKTLPDAVSKALRNQQVLQALTGAVTKHVASTLQDVVAKSTASAVNAAVPMIATTVEQKVAGQLHQAQKRHESDSAKIAHLTGLVNDLTESVNSMAAAQSEMIAKLAQMQQNLLSTTEKVVSGAPSSAMVRAPLPPPQKTSEQLEEEVIASLMAEGRFEEGTMRWLQSARSADLFDNVLVRYDPAFLSQVSALLNLSTGVTVTERFERTVAQRLMWLDAVLSNVNPHDKETSNVLPRILDILHSRLSTEYVRLNETAPNTQLLRHISLLINRLNELGRMT